MLLLTLYSYHLWTICSLALNVFFLDHTICFFRHLIDDVNPCWETSTEVFITCHIFFTRGLLVFRGRSNAPSIGTSILISLKSPHSLGAAFWSQIKWVHLAKNYQSCSIRDKGAVTLHLIPLLLSPGETRIVFIQPCTWCSTRYVGVPHHIEPNLKPLSFWFWRSTFQFPSLYAASWGLLWSLHWGGQLLPPSRIGRASYPLSCSNLQRDIYGPS